MSIGPAHEPGFRYLPEEKPAGSRLRAAWHEALEALDRAPSFGRNIWLNFRDGIYMAASILPSILSVGLIGLLLAKYTPLFEWFGYLFYPFTWITRMSEPLLTGQALSLGLVEMFLPSTQVADVDSFVTRFVVGIISVSGIIFFSAMVPSILATDIPIKLWHLVVIWFERVALSILIAAPLAHLLL
ncbi:hypothetical protein [Brevibacterium luteolum]|uniref:hypothetical protein n=1 Tax=Brevibacterium luteolum TaxID=199591 RepID=UPI001A9D2585|nr:hypothetical protein [Brevibacterium luteolum]